MWRMVFAALALPLCVTALWALDDKNGGKQKPPPSPAQQLQAIEKEHSKAEDALFSLSSKSDDEQSKLLARYREMTGPFTSRCLKLAEKYPKDPAAFDALVWVLQHQASAFTPDADKAAGILTHDYARDPRIVDVCRSFIRVHAPAAETLLLAVLAENPKKETRAAACLALAQMLAERADDEAMHGQNKEASATRKDAERRYEQVAHDFGDVKIDGKPAKDVVKPDLQELRTLAVGKTAPDIDGKDSSGKSFRLSDYRGKVAVLDFWARW